MRNSVPQTKTRWVLFDTKNMRLHSWIFFPTYKHALDHYKKIFRNELVDEKPKFYGKREDWENKKYFAENHVKILHARWHISRYDAIHHNLVEFESEREDGSESNRSGQDGDGGDKDGSGSGERPEGSVSDDESPEQESPAAS